MDRCTKTFTTAITASEMPAAIRLYSIAVAPLSSFRNLMIKRIRRVTPRIFAYTEKILWRPYRHSENDL